MAKKSGRVHSVFVTVRPSTTHEGWFEATVADGWPNDPDYRDDFPVSYGRTEKTAKALAILRYNDVLLIEARLDLQKALAKAGPIS